MDWRTAAVAALSACLAAAACTTAGDQVAQNAAPAGELDRNAFPDTPGTGPFAATKVIDPTLPEQVIYQPADLAGLGDVKLGVLAWGNGACTDDAATDRLHLLELASHGYLVIAPGRLYTGPGRQERPAGYVRPDPATAMPTRPEQLGQAIDWALEENARPSSAYFGKIDPVAVAVGGYSCGGLHALLNADDPRVATVLIMNSGLFLDGPTSMAGMTETKALLGNVHTPTLWILGGPTDTAFLNGLDDYARVDVPAAVASIDRGHGGTYWDPNGGAAAQVAADWLDWRLRGDADAGARFAGANCGLCRDPEWSYQSKGLN